MAHPNRLAWLETSLAVTGEIDKTAYERVFRISKATASNDLRDLVADFAQRGIDARVDWGQVRLQGRPDALGARGLDPDVWMTLGGLECLHDLARVYRPRTDTRVLGAVARAIANHRPLTFDYTSRTRGATTRTVSFHSLVRAAGRLHARGYDHAKNAFRDFVLARMTKVVGPAALTYVGSNTDAAWHAPARIAIRARPDLPDDIRRSVELEYDIPPAGTRIIETREAFRIYVLAELGLSGRRAAPIEIDPDRTPDLSAGTDEQAS